MSQENVLIRITDTGTKVVKKNIEDIGKEASTSQSSVNMLNRALTILGGVIGASQIIKYADSFNRLQNRLAVVSNGTLEVAAATEALYTVAQKSRTSFEDTVELYSRLALGSKELGVSQQQLVRFTESVSKAVSLSGATAQEAKAGLIQFSQGMASNRLGGDELRSVLEQLPVVADVIAKRMKVTRGELRELGAQGKITGRTIIEAFTDAGESIDERFAKKIPTIAESLTVIENSVMIFIGQLDKSLGLTSAFGTAAEWLAKNMNDIGAALTTLLPLLAILVGKAALGGILAALAGIAAFAVANPFVAIFAALGGYAVAVGQMDKEMDDFLKTMDRTATVGDKLKATAAGVRAYIEAAWENFPEWFGGMMERAVNLAVSYWAKLADKMKLAIEGVGKNIDSGVGGGSQFFTNMFKDIAGEFKGSDELISDLETKEEFLKRFPDTAMAAAGRARQAYRDALMDLSQSTSMLSDEHGDPSPIKQKPTKKGPRTFQDEFDKLAGQIEILQVNKESDARERLNRVLQLSQSLKGGLTSTQKEDLTNMLAIIQRLERQRKLYDEITQPQREYAQTVEALNVLYKDGEISVDAYNKKLTELNISLLETSTTIEGGLLRGALKLKEEFNDLASLAENGLVNAIKGAEDAFVSFVSKGKADFASLIDSMISDLVRLAVRNSITGPLSGILSGVMSGVMGNGGTGVAMQGSTGTSLSASSWMPQPKFATGGDITVGGSGGVDSQNVNFKATPGERIYIRKPGERDPTGNGVVVIAPNITIIDNVGVKVSTEQRENADGGFDMDIIIGQVASSLANDVRAGQGPLVGAFSDKFDLQPRPGGR